MPLFVDAHRHVSESGLTLNLKVVCHSLTALITMTDFKIDVGDLVSVTILGFVDRYAIITNMPIEQLAYFVKKCNLVLSLGNFRIQKGELGLSCLICYLASLSQEI